MNRQASTSQITGDRLERRRSQRRFWTTLDSRFSAYYWPESITAACPRCGACMPFFPTVRNSWHKEGSTYRLLDMPVGGRKEGTGSCTACGSAFRSITWPADAYYRSCTKGGDYWAWNENYLHVLRARVGGDSVRERQLCMQNYAYHYFLSRLPKYVVLKHNRKAIIRKIDQWLEGPGACPTSV